ncbi:MAG TPA: fibronectin type III domain-containing protein [Candidatus Paceibacterota bacterium]|nr:fibronectin type III domain-containing protein [Candidatus Paceibacterota bacterium]
MKSSSKIILTVLVVGALSASAYFFSNKAEGQSSDDLLRSEVTNKAVGIPQNNPTTDQTIQSILRQVANIDNIKLNTDIFEKPEFLALKDISQELPAPTDIGRPNPFAPIGVDVGVIATDEGITGDSISGSGVLNGLPGDPLAPISQVKTKEVQNIGQRSATVLAETAIAGSTPRWFEWGTNQNTINKTTKQTGSDAAFTATLTGLTPNTTYYVKAAVEQNGGTAFGETISFKTAQ